MTKRLEFFSEARIALFRECKHHPVLVTFLQAYSQDQYPEAMGEIAAYCNIGMDGLYSQADLEKLCGILYEKLVAMRTIVAVPYSVETASLPELFEEPQDKLKQLPDLRNEGDSNDTSKKQH